MRRYLTERNLLRSIGLGAILTLMSIPRIEHAGFNIFFYLPATLAITTLFSGAILAWGNCGGLAGIVPDQREDRVNGLWYAAMLGAVLSGFQVLLDPLYIHAIEEARDPRLMRLLYPPTMAGCLALMLWSAGFESAFFQGATMSFFTRLNGHWWIALPISVAFRVYVVSRKLADTGIAEFIPVFLLGTAVSSIVGCVLFARHGLPSAMTFQAIMSSHVLFHIP